MDYKKSLDEIEKALTELQEENKNVPILVEGEKDIEALRKLGLNGIILSVNTGIGLSDFCDGIAKKYKEIIVLTDWDRRGGRLCRTISMNLKGRVFCNMSYRELFAKKTMIRTVEGLPSWIKTMQNKLNIV